MVRVRSDVPAGGPPFDVVMESVGGETLRSALRLLRGGGQLLWFGQAGGQPVTLDFFEFWRGPVEATISHVDYTHGERTFGEELATLVGLVAGDRLHPEIGVVRPWTKTPEVIALLRGRQVRGNAVLVVAPRQAAEEPPRRRHHAH